MTMKQHIMIDIETLGDQSNSVITSIAAVPFKPNEEGFPAARFYQKVSIQSCLDLGLRVSGDTLVWWLNQDQKAVMEMLENARPLQQVMLELWAFIMQMSKPDVIVWCKGARFDFGLLRDAFKACSLEVPWKFWNERDLRTLLSLYPEVKKLDRSNNLAHSAHHDCLHQIKQLQSIAKELKKVGLEI